MGGGHLPPGFPVPNPTVSYWQTKSHRLAHHRTTETLPDTLFDYVIIGSGITGAATAFKLLSRHPELNTLMLEARTAASGASGRNGGHCRTGWWLNFLKYREKFGDDEVLLFEHLEAKNVKDIANLVKDYEIECDFKDVETADVYYDPKAWAEVKVIWNERNEFYRRKGFSQPIEMNMFEGEAAGQRLGLEGVEGCVTYPAHTQNPYLLVCSVLEMCLEKGMNLQAETPALHLSKSEDGNLWQVDTDRGIVRSERVVLATNAYTPALHAGIRATGFLNPSRSQVSAVRPAKNSLIKHKTVGRSVGLNDRHSGDYFFIRQSGVDGEGDLLYGGGRFVSPTREHGVTDDSTVHVQMAEYLKSSAKEIIGWEDDTLEVRDWSGITCYTPDTFPLVGEVPGEKGLFACVGGNGHGMAMMWRSAEGLVTLIEQGEYPSFLPKQYRIERAFEQKKEEADVKPIAVE